ncbi:MAG TPA: hypothetical protein VGC51_08400 [Hansschlegelia sp.]
MSDPADRPEREALSAVPRAVLDRLPLLGRAMLTANRGGATHERIGPITAVTFDGDVAALAGDCHDAVIDLTVVVRAVADRSGKMKDRALPRVEFQGADGETVFSVIALEGLELFEAALATLKDGEALPPKEKPADGGPAELGENDPGLEPFAAARAAEGEVVVSFATPGLTQRWRGRVPEIKPISGFINVMTSDFHLHLRGGAVARWRREEGADGLVLTAEDAAGAPTGLTVSGPASSFAPS